MRYIAIHRKNVCIYFQDQTVTIRTPFKTVKTQLQPEESDRLRELLRQPLALVDGQDKLDLRLYKLLRKIGAVLVCPYSEDNHQKLAAYLKTAQSQLYLQYASPEADILQDLKKLAETPIHLPATLYKKYPFVVDAMEDFQLCYIINERMEEIQVGQKSYALRSTASKLIIHQSDKDLSWPAAADRLVESPLFATFASLYLTIYLFKAVLGINKNYFYLTDQFTCAEVDIINENIHGTLAAEAIPAADSLHRPTLVRDLESFIQDKKLPWAINPIHQDLPQGDRFGASSYTIFNYGASESRYHVGSDYFTNGLSVLSRELADYLSQQDKDKTWLFTTPEEYHYAKAAEIAGRIPEVFELLRVDHASLGPDEQTFLSQRPALQLCIKRGQKTDIYSYVLLNQAQSHIFAPKRAGQPVNQTVWDLIINYEYWEKNPDMNNVYYQVEPWNGSDSEIKSLSEELPAKDRIVERILKVATELKLNYLEHRWKYEDMFEDYGLVARRLTFNDQI